MYWWRFKEIYDGYMLAIALLAGVFLLARDVPLLRKKKMIRDMKIAKVLGYFYIIGGIILYVFARVY